MEMQARQILIFYAITSLLFFLLSCTGSTPLPILPVEGIHVSEVTSTTIKIEWTPSPSEKDSKDIFYKVVITTEPSIYDNTVLASTMVGKSQVMDWIQNKYTIIAQNLDPETEYHIAVLARNNSSKPVLYKPVTATTLPPSSPEKMDLTVIPPEMVFIQGGRMDIQGNEVTVEDFYISKYEVTQREYYAIEKWSYEYGYNDHLTEEIYIDKNIPGSFRWYGAIQYCNLLSMSSSVKPVYYEDENLTRPITEYNYTEKQDFYISKTANGYRLPTEFEWEYAARGGNESKGYIYSGSNDIEEVAWYEGDQKIGSWHPVGKKKSNELGLYDMSGNAAEWCINWCPNSASTFIENSFHYKTNDLPKSRLLKGGDTAHQEPVGAWPKEYYKPTLRICEELNFRFGGKGLRIIQIKKNE